VIDRRSVVRRHCIELTHPDPATVLTVGNGNFAFTPDITGMQTFGAFHDQEAARANRRLAVNTATMATWGWHSMPSEQEFTLADAMTSHLTTRGPVPYPDKFSMTAAMGGAADLRAGMWLHVNPQRLDLGRIGLLLRCRPDSAPAPSPDDLGHPRQRLDLWTGEITSEFEYAGQPVRISTVADPIRAQVAFRIESALLASGQASVAIRFPYASDGFFQTSDWSRPDAHHTVLDRVSERVCRFTRVLDHASYIMRLDWTRGRISHGDGPHEFILSSEDAALEIVAGFWPQDRPALARATYPLLLERATAWWRGFWTTGAAIDFAGSTDPRAAELERRVVLSQYLTAVNCSGAMPPQETGLITNSWQGKSHLEMHWWHAAHFAAWGRPWLLERSLTWYESILGTARATAARQGYDGARWPKQVGPDGRESPGGIAPFLIWQQPHLLYLLELLHRGRGPRHRAAALTRRFEQLAEDTARFMASFAEERDGSWHLPAPVIPAQETYEALSTEDPTFELAYWWWGLEIAQRWRERRGRKRSDRWQRIQDGLARPRIDRGHYCAIATSPYLRRTDHPSLLCALGFVPATPLVDAATMEATLLHVRDTWDWDTAWGWDFPAMAMTATRLHRPDLAVDALLADSPKNSYLPTGHCPQIGSLLPVYLPANGALLAAVSLMIAGWDEAGTELPGFPKDGSWTIHHEGFEPWP